jgi:hypothetical protein
MRTDHEQDVLYGERFLTSKAESNYHIPRIPNHIMVTS